MANHTRRDVLRGAGALAAGLASPGAVLAAAQAGGTPTERRAPDVIVHNALVYTMDEAQPQAEAFAVSDGRFTAIGRSADVLNLKGLRTQVIDGQGRAVFPGFIDAHTHPAWGGIEEITAVNCDLPSIAAIKAAIHKRALATPPGGWVQGFKYDDTKVVEKRRLRREDLDEAAPNHPVAIKHRGGHLNWFNSRAFALAGITAATPDPEGGAFYRRDGQLDGGVAEKALSAFAKVVPRDHTRAQRHAGVTLMARLMTAAGLTSVHDVECSAAHLTSYQDAYHAGELLFRVYVLVQGYAPIYRQLRDAGVYGGLGDDRLRIGGVKFLADGSAQERTMRMSTPYVGRPDDYGILTMTQEEIDVAAVEADQAGFQIGIHANGDVAIDMVLKAYDKVKAGRARPGYRPRIEHCSLVNPDLLRRIKQVGAVPLPFYTYAHYHGDKWAEYGQDKMRWMFAHRSFLDYGIPVAPASDYIPGPFEPLMAIQSMVTRKDYAGRVWGPNQRITVADALKICTMGGAYASYEEHVKGSIAVGKLADFVLLETDPHHADADSIKAIRVMRTVVGGATVHNLEA
jgi:predicted amidohydrolase YtcJ